MKDNYHSDYAAVSRSMLTVFRESRREYELRYILKQGPEEETTQPMKLGSLAHSLLLTPNKAKEEFKIIPQELLSADGGVRTKACREWVDSCEGSGHSAVKPDQWKEAELIATNLRAKIGTWIDRAESIEQPIYWTDPLTGIRCKAKPDFIVPGVINGESHKILIDIKTTNRIIPHTFSRRFEDGGYWLQQAHYTNGILETTGMKTVCYFPAIEQSWPHRCAVFEMGPGDVLSSQRVWRETMNELAWCVEKNDFSDPWEEGISRVELKPWIFRERETA